jgi:hypothetical protein
MMACELHLPLTVHTDVVLLILWHVWKARNSRIFENLNPAPLDIIGRVVKDLDL